MKFQFYKNNIWNDISEVTDVEIFDNIDGYNGSESEVYLKIVNETNDPQRTNVMLRMVEKYNNSEFPLKKNDDFLVVSGGNPKLDSKLSYLVKRNVTLNDSLSGYISVPDENGLVKLGDLAANNGIIYFSVKVKSEGKTLLSFGELLKVSDIYFFFTALTK